MAGRVLHEGRLLLSSSSPLHVWLCSPSHSWQGAAQGHQLHAQRLISAHLLAGPSLATTACL